MREMELLIFLKKGLFCIKVMYLKQKKKRIKRKQFFKYIENESKGINYDLFKNYFNFVAPTVLPKKKYYSKQKIKRKTMTLKN